MILLLQATCYIADFRLLTLEYQFIFFSSLELNINYDNILAIFIYNSIHELPSNIYFNILCKLCLAPIFFFFFYCLLFYWLDEFGGRLLLWLINEKQILLRHLWQLKDINNNIYHSCDDSFYLYVIILWYDKKWNSTCNL